MKPFKSVAIVKHPIEQVWLTVLNRLPDLVPFMEDMEKISQLKREDLPYGVTRLDNLWQAKPMLRLSPGSSTATGQGLQLKPEMFAWIDRAEWRPQDHACHWQIESRFMPDALKCWGVTSYEPAIGGRGTRVTFEGKLGMSTGTLLPGLGFLDGSLMSGFETLASSLIPKNMRKMTEAVGIFLDQYPARD